MKNEKRDGSILIMYTILSIKELLQQEFHSFFTMTIDFAEKHGKQKIDLIYKNVIKLQINVILVIIFFI